MSTVEAMLCKTGAAQGSPRVDFAIGRDAEGDQHGILDGERMVVVAVKAEPLVVLVRIGVPLDWHWRPTIHL